MRKALVAIVIVLVIACGGAAAFLLLGRPSEAPDPAAEQEGAALEEEPIVSERTATPVTFAEAPVQAMTTDTGLTVTAPEAFLETDELAAVEDEIAAIEARGSHVCVSLVDLETRRGLSYDAEREMYPASCIKALFCTWLFETHGDAGGMSDTVADCIINSSNDAYHALIDAFGIAPFLSWLASHGGPDYDRSWLYFYPNMTAAQLETAWEEVCRFCSSGEAGADELAGYLSQTDPSPIASTLRGDSTVWSKAGWYPADSAGLSTSNDAGAVFSETGTYVLVVMTDISSDLDALEPLVGALDAAHAKMCGDDVAYHTTD